MSVKLLCKVSDRAINGVLANAELSISIKVKAKGWLLVHSESYVIRLFFNSINNLT